MRHAIRTATESDHNFILSSWLQSYRKHARCQFLPEASIYYKGHEALIKKKLGECHVLYNLEDPDQIMGWGCGVNGVAHYLYVKAPFRRFGLSKIILKHMGGMNEFSHLTQFSHFYARLKPIYNPYSFTES